MINSSIILKNKDIQKYLFNLDPSLNIEQWIIESNNVKNTKYKQIGKIILNKIQTGLDKIISNYQDYQDEMICTGMRAPTMTATAMAPTMTYRGYHSSSLYQRHASDMRYNPMRCSNPNTIIILLIQ